jgi:farnesol kinase
MWYFNIFGFVDKSWAMVGGFGVVSLGAAVVESLPISTRLDDNLTVPLASALLGALVFHLIIPPTNLQGGSSSSTSISAIVDMVLFPGGSS